MIKKILFILLLLCSPVYGSVDFDGVDDSIYFDNNDVFDAEQFTVCMWLKTSMTAAAWNLGDQFWTGTWITQRDLAGLGNEGWFLIFGDGSEIVKFGISDDYDTNDYATSTTDIGDGVWHHVCGKKDVDTTYIYIDGVEEDTLADANTASNNSEVFMGRDPDEVNDPYDGEITEYAIWSNDLTQAEITKLSSSMTKRYPCEIQRSNLIAYLPMTGGDINSSADGDSISQPCNSDLTITSYDGPNNTGLTWERDPLRVRMIN